MKRIARASRALWAAAAIAALPAMGSAQDVAAAADAFSRAQEAELRGEWEQAAELYALADRIAPTPEALRSAAIAAERAGLAATAATYAEALVARSPNDRESREVADRILGAHADSLARIEARCAPECRVLLDGRVVVDRPATQHVFYARPGDRRITASFEAGRASEAQAVALVAGDTTRLELEPSADADPIDLEGAGAPRPGSGGGISPGFFIGGAVLTAVGVGLTIWSGLEVLDAHDTYDPTAADAQRRYEAGRELETRTNVIIGVTSGLALVTVLLAVFTDWDGDPPPESQAANDTGRFSLGVDDRSLVVGWTRWIP